MSSAKRRLAAAVLAALLVGVSAAACSSSPSSTGSRSTKSGQQIFNTKLDNDLNSLDQGVLTYTPLRTIETGAPTYFDVWVTDIGKKSAKQDISALEMSKQLGRAVFSKDVPTGGYVAVWMTGCPNLHCRHMSTNPQLAEPHHHPPEWVWLISPRAPGPASISLQVDTYKGFSTKLLAERPVLVKLNVRANPHYTPTASPVGTRPPVASGGASSTATVWATVLAAVIGGIFAIVAAWVGARAVRRRTSGGSASKS
jgi:hypothetical protein